MARETKTARLGRIHAEAFDLFNRIVETEYEQRMACLEDRRFESIAGAQWEGSLRDQFANKPRLEINKVQGAVNRVISEYRNNRITVDFIPRDGAPSDATADALDDLYRADEHDSYAVEAYDTAFAEGVSGGFGAWRLTTCYEYPHKKGDERQRIRIEPIPDADKRVFFDLGARRQDKSDAKWCYVLNFLPRKDYEDLYEDNVSDWPDTISQSMYDWVTPEYVVVADVYHKELERVQTITFRREATEEEQELDVDDLDDETLDTLIATGWVEVSREREKRERVRKYIMSGSKILEDCGYIAGSEIPIVPYYGKRWYVDGIERMAGVVRYAKDAQRLKNMQISALAELAASSGREKPIFTPQQVEGHELRWAKDNVENYPYQLVNPIVDGNGQLAPLGPVGMATPPNIPAAMTALIQLSEMDLLNLLGVDERADKVVSHVSGEAIDMIQRVQDMPNFIYLSNFSRAMTRSGQIWLSMVRDVMVEPGRKLKGIGADGNIRQIELKRPVIGSTENDFEDAEYDVWVETGPSSASRRASAARQLTGILPMVQDPATSKMILSMLLMNLEGEGLSDTREYMRKELVQMGVLKPTPEEAKAMQEAAANAQPSPEQQYLMAEAAKSEAQARKAEADTEVSVANADKLRADTAKILAEIPGIRQEQILAVLDVLAQETGQGAEMTTATSQNGEG